MILPPRVCEKNLLKMMLKEENATRAKEGFQETKVLASVPVEHKSVELITKYGKAWDTHFSVNA